MNEDQKKQLIQKYISCYNTFDIEGMLSTLHPNIEFKNISNGDVTASASNLSEFKQLAEQAKRIFKSREQKIERYEVVDNKIIIEIAYKGILAIDLPNGLKAGEALELTGKSEFMFKDNQISYIKDIS